MKTRQKRVLVYLDIDKTLTSKDFFHGVKYKGKEFYNVLANDVVPERMKNIVNEIHRLGFKITVFTGRDRDYKKCTIKFWRKNFPNIRCKIHFCGENGDTFNYENYTLLKVEKMIRHTIKNECDEIVVIDDDQNIIDALKRNMLFVNLRCFKIPEDIEDCERLIRQEKEK